jgi:uncharacterized protein
MNCPTILFLEDKYMKHFLLFFCLLAGVMALGQGIDKVVPAKPNPPRLVNDFANVLTPEQEQALESKLVAYDDSTSNQIAVVTIQTTGDYAVQEVGLEILRRWGVGGQAKKDNGLVLLVAVNDRSVNISTGYGLEGAVPDITAKNIIENDIVPQFRAGNYYRGLDAGTSSVMRAAAGEYQAPENYRNRGTGSGGISFGKIFIAFIILMFIMNMFGGGGGRGGGFMSRRGYRRFGGGPIFIPGGFGGGGFGGGGFGGGGGGGFGGFGGGSGGGGGASGSW